MARQQAAPAPATPCAPPPAALPGLPTRLLPQALLEAGAVPDLADGSGESAMDAAEQANNPQLMELLASYSGAAAAPAPEVEAAGSM